MNDLMLLGHDGPGPVYQYDPPLYLLTAVVVCKEPKSYQVFSFKSTDPLNGGYFMSPLAHKWLYLCDATLRCGKVMSQCLENGFPIIKREINVLKAATDYFCFVYVLLHELKQAC